MESSKLKIGIIGCGGIANQKHMPSLKRLSAQCEMVAFCDIVLERAEKACEKYGSQGAKVYSDYKELLSDKSIDVVHILTPNVSHCPITVDAFEAGKHVMCEKPMAASTSDAQKMMDAWNKSGKKFTIGYQNRFRDDIQHLHKSCENGDLGEIYIAKAHAVRRRLVPTWGVFMDKEQQGGGPLIDIGTHALDITLWCMDNYKPVSVLGQVFYKLGKLTGDDQGNFPPLGNWDADKYEVEDSAVGMIKLENGATIYLEASWALNTTDVREGATTLCGTKAGAEIKDNSPGGGLVYNYIKYNRQYEERPSQIAGAAYMEDGLFNPEYLEAKNWLESIINDTEPLVRPHQAFVVTQILDAIYKSAKTGELIKFN